MDAGCHQLSRSTFLSLLVIGTSVPFAGCSRKPSTNIQAAQSSDIDESALKSEAPSLKTFILERAAGETTGLQLDLSGNYVMEKHVGPDFVVFYLLDKENKRSIGVYLGSFPSLQS